MITTTTTTKRRATNERGTGTESNPGPSRTKGRDRRETDRDDRETHMAIHGRAAAQAAQPARRRCDVRCRQRRLRLPRHRDGAARGDRDRHEEARPGRAVSDGPNIAEFGPCDCPIHNRRTGEVMPHWRSLVESKYLSHFELQG